MFVRIDSIYGWLIFFVMLTLGLVGFIDDYIKVVKKNKSGLAGKFKIAGQVTVGLSTIIPCGICLEPSALRISLGENRDAK